MKNIISVWETFFYAQLALEIYKTLIAYMKFKTYTDLSTHMFYILALRWYEILVPTLVLPFPLVQRESFFQKHWQVKRKPEFTKSFYALLKTFKCFFIHCIESRYQHLSTDSMGPKKTSANLRRRLFNSLDALKNVKHKKMETCCKVP